jgi:isopentenyl diphosphate isomerase/L-lactate dehydrogenase-like FMN-dependent dehydrogenase
VILYGKVYDVSFFEKQPGGKCLANWSKVTGFLQDHPGGAQAILRYGGRDATDDFDLIHPLETFKQIESTYIGLCKQEERSSSAQASEPVDKIQLHRMLNLDEIEDGATKVVSKKAWAYYYSAADDKISKHLNTQAYRSILLRPRIFVDCQKCDLETTLLGEKVGLPLFVSPTAMARLGHSLGEAGIAQGCRPFGALQIIANNSSITPEDIVANAPSTQIFGWQLYVQLNRKSSEDMLARVNCLAQIKFVVLTLDAPVSGKREDDERINVQASTAGSISSQLFAGTDPSLTWSDTLEWLSQHTRKPVILKGIQTHEDALLATQYAPFVKAIVLSNHGGRSLDTAPPAVHTLLEIRKFCPTVFDQVEVWVDGGIRRGTDAIKALCLGARAVGIGRPALWGLAAGGVEGVERTLKSEKTIRNKWTVADSMASTH